MVLNDYCPKIEVNPETYEVFADGELITCEPAKHYHWHNVILCTKMKTSFKIIDQIMIIKKLLDEISLSYEERFIRRKN